MRTTGRDQRTLRRAVPVLVSALLVGSQLGACDSSSAPARSVTHVTASTGTSATPSRATGVVRAAGLQVSGSVGHAELTQVLQDAQVAREWVARTWPQQIADAGTVHVQVAADAAQFARLRGGAPESTELAASTTSSGVVVVGPAVVRELTAQGQRVVLAHELTHVVLRQTARSGLPRWVVEGSAEFTAYRWSGLSLAAACPTLAADVRAGRVPVGPPSVAAFSGDQQQRAYQQAHGFMSFLVARFGLTAWEGFVVATSAGSADAFAERFGGASPAGLQTAYAAFLRRTLG